MIKYFRKKKLEKLGIFIDSVDQLNKGLNLEVESPCHINGARLSTFDNKVKKIGAYTYFRSDIRVASFSSIGRFCSIARGVRIGEGSHPIDWLSTHPFTHDASHTGGKGNIKDASHLLAQQSTVIGNDVWIGTNAIVMDGLIIGDGAVIAAGAVVTKNVEPYSIVGGVPAKHIKYRFEEDIRKRLVEIQWWNYDPCDVLKNGTVDDIKRFIAEFDATSMKLIEPTAVKISRRAATIKV